MNENAILPGLSAVLILLLFTACSRTSLPHEAVNGVWKQTRHVPYTSWEKIKRHLGDSPEVFNEFRLQRLDEYKYTHPESTVVLQVRVYHLASSDDAYGLYSYLLPADSERYMVGDEAFRVGTVLVVKRGNAVLRITPFHGAVTLDSMLAFATDICKKLPAGTVPQTVETLKNILKAEASTGIRYGHSNATASQVIIPEILKHLHLTAETDYACCFTEYLGRDAVMFVIEYPSTAEALRVYSELKELKQNNLIFNLLRQDSLVEFLIYTASE
jgi:hypothetical protein